MENNAFQYLPPIKKFRKYLMRWRFDFLNKPCQYGFWSRDGDGKIGSAWCVNKEGLVRASIEGKNLQTKKIEILAECDGHDFCNMEWMRAAVQQGLFIHGGKLPSLIIGMSIVTRDLRMRVYVDGEMEVIPRTEKDKKYHYASYGK